MEKALLNLKEICDYLGLGETKVRQLLKSKECDFSLKIGNRWYANKKALDNWINRRTGKIDN